MKTIVTYKSKYGSAKQYAQWLAEALDCTAVDIKKVKPQALAEYDTVIHGGGLYAGGLAGLGFYKKNKNLLDGKSFLVFATGASPYDEKVVAELKKIHFKDFMPETPVFYCEGNYSYPKMTPLHKMMMRMMNSMLKKQIKEKGEVDDWAKGFQSIIFSEYEHADKKFLVPIVEAVKTL